MRQVGNKRVVGVWLVEKRRNTEKQFRSRKCRTPVVFENVETYTAVAVDIRVKNGRNELDMRGLEWIVDREVNIEEEYATGIRTAFRSGNRRAPFHNIVIQRSTAAVGRWITDKFGQFFLNTFGYTHCEEMYMDGMGGMDFLYSYYFIFLYQFYE